MVPVVGGFLRAVRWLMQKDLPWTSSYWSSCPERKKGTIESCLVPVCWYNINDQRGHGYPQQLFGYKHQFQLDFKTLFVASFLGSKVHWHPSLLASHQTGHGTTINSIQQVQPSTMGALAGSRTCCFLCQRLYGLGQGAGGEVRSGDGMLKKMFDNRCT